MGVYIKDMKMPKNCLECEIRSYDANAGEEYCPFSQMECLSIGIQDNCPLIEVPVPHGRLIDADALADDLEYDAIHFEEEHEMKSNCASWLRSNDNITVIEAEGE